MVLMIPAVSYGARIHQTLAHLGQLHHSYWKGRPPSSPMT